MVTPEELRKRPILLELRLGGNTSKLTWLVSEEHEYSKLENMSGKDCVDFMLTDEGIARSEEDRKYVQTINEFIETEGKGYYSISTLNMGTIVCALYPSERDSQGNIITKIFEDQRQKKIIDRLISTKSKEKNSRYQQLRIITPKWVS